MSDVKKFVDLFPYGTCFHLSRDGNLSCRYSEFDSSCVDFIEDATNNHDRLVEENAELRELVKLYKLSSDEVTKYKHVLSYNESYAGEPMGEMKNNLAELDMVSCKALQLLNKHGN